jgi:glutamyl-tRNA reductase
MHLVLIGLSYKTAPIELRERVSISKAQLPEALGSLSHVAGVRECVILSTCNRTEIYASTETRDADSAIVNWLAHRCHLTPEELDGHTYITAGHKAAEHLFRVVPGLDSMVLGETQILGQVKEAYAAALETKTVGQLTNTLFQQALAAAKRIVSETGIGRGAFSVGSAAARLARSVFGDLRSSTLLIVGAGKMAELTTSHLTALGVSNLLITSRTTEHAEELASRYEAQSVAYEDLGFALEKADIVVSSTGAEGNVITRKMVQSAMRARRGRPMFIIDLAVPRDVEETAADIDNVFLYNIDDLEAVVEANDASRRAEIEKAERIISEEVAEFNRWFRTLDAVPVITALREKFEGIRKDELEKLLKKLQHLSPQDVAAIDAAMRSLINKICHQPMIQIKQCASDPGASAKLEAMCEAFGLCPANDKSEPLKRSEVG